VAAVAPLDFHTRYRSAVGAQIKKFNAQAQIAQVKNKIGKAQTQIAQEK